MGYPWWHYNKQIKCECGTVMNRNKYISSSGHRGVGYFCPSKTCAMCFTFLKGKDGMVKFPDGTKHTMQEVRDKYI